MVDQAFPIVGVGASAGGIEAFTELLKNLPAAPGIAIVFVLHQDPNHESLLTQVVARSSRMPVELIRDGTRVEVDRVYVIPQDHELTIAVPDDGQQDRRRGARVDRRGRIPAEGCRDAAGLSQRLLTRLWTFSISA